MSLSLPKRTEKPRKRGLTMILEKGLNPVTFRNQLKYYHRNIDIVKFTSGIGLIDPAIEEKISACKEFGIDVYFGGTLFEKYYHAKALDAYVHLLEDHGIHCIEISDGVVQLPQADKNRLIKELKPKFKIFNEIGSKDTTFVMPPSKWVFQMQESLDAGADYLIVEGRESGTSGLYRTSGEMRTGLLEEIMLNIDTEKVIFEAPNSKSQCYLINTISPNVNLGNIPLLDINMLEVQRAGLRYSTFFNKTGIDAD